jgi:hypothetical protein
MSRSLPPRLRWRILERDGFRCTYCGAGAADGAQLEVDHVVPHSAGGSDLEANLTTACATCNNGKSAAMSPPVLTGYTGAACPTRLRIAHIAVYSHLSFPRMLREWWHENPDYAPPPRRDDGQWLTIAKADPAGAEKWIVDALTAVIGD